MVKPQVNKTLINKGLQCLIFLVQLDRKPSKCVVFEDDLRGITAAHNCTMMAVALIGAHRAYVYILIVF